MEEKFQMQRFKEPKAVDRSVPFWSWNCKVTKGLIDRQLDCFQKMGFGGVDIHPRVGLDVEYLGDEFMELVRYTVEKCRKMGLRCWLYDDDRYPSGAADGLVTRDLHYRDRGLFLSEQELEGFCENREIFEEKIAKGEKFRGYFVGIYGLDFRDGLLQAYCYEELPESAEKLKVAGYHIRYAYVKLAEESSSFEGQTYVDTLNPEAIGEFIRLTHARYQQTLGEEFGKTAEAIFTDEPRIGKQIQIASAASTENFEIPYSEGFAERFRQETGEELLKCVPELIWDMPEEGYYRKRYVYRNALAECFTESYMDQICNWCKEEGILMTGHVLSESPLLHQAATVGECMRSYRSMDIPGVDVLLNDPEYVTVKQAVSVSRQLGRQGTMSELYGVTDWDCSFKTYKLQGDWQAALGITHRVPHLSFMSMGGEAKRDWPASIFSQSPWYPEYPHIEDHFARIRYALDFGRPVVRVAVLHPIESTWLHMGQKDRNEADVERIQNCFRQITEALLFSSIDTDYVSESMLPGLWKDRGALLGVGEMSYEAVIIPSMDTIRSSTLTILQRFLEAGGRIICIGEAPQLVDACRSGEAEKLFAGCEHTGIDELPEVLWKQRDVEVRQEDGSRAENLFYQLRKEEQTGEKRLLLCHVRETGDAAEHLRIRIRGNYEVKLYDTQTGEEQSVPVNRDGETTEWLWEAYGEDSILLRLFPAEEKTRHTNESRENYDVVKHFNEPDDVTLQEENVLLLDKVRYQLEDSPASGVQDILKADDEIRKTLGYAKRSEHMLQPYIMEEGEKHSLQLFYEITSEIEDPVKLALELPEDCKIFLNEQSVDVTSIRYYVDEAISVIQLPNLTVGKNELRLQIGFHQKVNLESMYLLGDFGVELCGTENRLCHREKDLKFGDITMQKLPFYTGNIVYGINVNIDEDGEYALRIPDWKAPVLGVHIDGEDRGIIAYAPYRKRLGKLAKGEHRIEVCLYGNRFNTFGILHNCDPKLTWIGPMAYRTEGDCWTDEYRIRPTGILGEVLLEREKH